jgi:S-(hydroxymethyl)glutathione dehydrogenase/alcohol dehydrogenase
MTLDARAAVFRKPGAPLTIEPVQFDAPGRREVLVRTAAVGVCHTDLHVIDGTRPYGPDPIVLGHEAAGVVEAVGADVTYLRPGDHVVACISGFCGACEQCLAGRPNLCSSALIARSESDSPRLSQAGRRVEQFYNIGGFAERMLLHENSLVRIDAGLPLDQAALMGCAVLTGLGAVFRTAGVHPGDTVAVFGCGGVGLSIVQGARLAGARRIIAVDLVEAKLELATRLGATDIVNARALPPVESVRALTDGRGVDHAFEAVGSVALVRQCVESLAVAGTATIVGALASDAVIEIPWSALRPECKVQTSRMGSNRFRIDIPRYLDFYRQGRLLLDELITRRGRLDDVNDAFAAMRTGEEARTVLTFD